MLIFGGAYVRRKIFVSKSIGLTSQLEGNLLFLLCFTLHLRAIFQVQAAPRGGGVYIWRGDLKEVFLRYRIWGLIFGGAYTWRGLFSEFYGRIFNLTMSVFCSNTNFCSRMLEMHSKRPRLQTFPETHSFRALKSRLYSKFFLPHLLHILLKNPVFQTLIK